MCPRSVQDVLTAVVAGDVAADELRAMSARERRYALYYLRDRERASLDRLGDVVAGWLAAADGRVTTAAERESLLLALHHRHLPLLADAGLVAFDAADGVVEPSLSEPVRDLLAATYRAERHDAAGREE